MKFNRSNDRMVWFAWGGIIVSVIVFAVAFLPTFCRRIDRINVTDQRLSSVVVASKSFKAEFGRWPSTIDELTNNTKGIVFIEWGHQGAVDSWCNEIVYMPFNEREDCGLAISWGADGKPGGDKKDRDRILKIQ